MLAHAITKQPKQIAIFGIDMNSAEEYAKQRAGFQHFMDIAEQHGIHLLAPDESDILQPPPLYGYDRTSAMVRKLVVRKKEYADRMDLLKRKVEGYAQQIASLKGAIEEIEYMENTWTGCYGEPAIDAGPVDWHPTPKMVDTQAAPESVSVRSRLTPTPTPSETIDG